ncbi:MAG: NAD(P)H-dependent glycerol-3-phosphate dehydrogenase [Methanobrevibacter sp.]|nr:NAD(P)H-dependent glycerol-3-phosphate dehydrogenase [Methanobrevibacter sp.]
MSSIGSSKKVGVVGAGSFGTALAQITSKNVEEVLLYSRKEKIAENILKTRYNSEYYPNTKLKKNIIPTSNLEDMKKCSTIFICVPSFAFRKTLQDIKQLNIDNLLIVTTAKGIEYPSLKTMGKIVEEYFDDNYVAISGPNFASQIMLDLATVCNVASKNSENSEKIKKMLQTEKFKVKIIDDVVGLEFCGVIKNINAIAYGICEGININENAKYAVLAKGFKETKKIIEGIGGDRSTVNQYCGFGDLVLTSTSKESRNHTLGMLYGQKIIVDEESSSIVFEGKNSIMAVKDICDKHSINSTIVDFVYNVIVNQKTPKLSFKELWDNF